MRLADALVTLLRLGLLRMIAETQLPIIIVSVVLAVVVLALILFSYRFVCLGQSVTSSFVNIFIITRIRMPIYMWLFR